MNRAFLAPKGVRRAFPRRNILGPCAMCLVVLTVFSSDVAQAAVAKDPLAVCTRHLRAIGHALRQYQHDHHAPPPRLLDLYPKYIRDPYVFVCPADRFHRTPAPNSARKDLPVSYSYEMRAEKGNAGLQLGHFHSTPSTTLRDAKMAQRANYGDRVPVVRCMNHPAALNLTLSGQVYSGGGMWEYDPGTIAVVLTRMEADLRAGYPQFQRRWDAARVSVYLSQLRLIASTGGTTVPPVLRQRLLDVAHQFATRARTASPVERSSLATIAHALDRAAATR